MANLLARVRTSGARFAVTTGDNGYPNGSQLVYGDLQQHGADTERDLRPELLGGAGKLDPSVRQRRKPRSREQRGCSRRPGELAAGHCRCHIERQVHGGHLLLCERHEPRRLQQQLVRVRCRERSLLHAGLGVGRHERGHGQRLRQRRRRALRAGGPGVRMAAPRSPDASHRAEVRVLALPGVLGQQHSALRHVPPGRGEPRRAPHPVRSQRLVQRSRAHLRAERSQRARRAGHVRHRGRRRHPRADGHLSPVRRLRDRLVELQQQGIEVWSGDRTLHRSGRCTTTSV